VHLHKCEIWKVQAGSLLVNMQTDGCRSLYMGDRVNTFISDRIRGIESAALHCVRDSNGSTADHSPLHSSHPMTRGDLLLYSSPGFSDAHTRWHTHTTHTISACIHDNTHRVVYSTVHDKRDWQRGTKKEANLNPRLLYTNNPWDYRFFLVVCQVARIVIYRLEGAGGYSRGSNSLG
jgi:hypothetical protein